MISLRVSYIKFTIFFYILIYSVSIFLIFLYLIEVPGSQFFRVLYQWKEILILPLMLYVTEASEHGNYRAVNIFKQKTLFSCFMLISNALYSIYFLFRVKVILQYDPNSVCKIILQNKKEISMEICLKIICGAIYYRYIILTSIIIIATFRIFVIIIYNLVWCRMENKKKKRIKTLYINKI